MSNQRLLSFSPRPADLLFVSLPCSFPGEGRNQFSHICNVRRSAESRVPGIIDIIRQIHKIVREGQLAVARMQVAARPGTEYQ